jgi:hypothetical protein
MRQETGAEVVARYPSSRLGRYYFFKRSEALDLT